MYIKDEQAQKINIFTLSVQYLEKHSNTMQELVFRDTHTHIFEGSYVGDTLYHSFFPPFSQRQPHVCVCVYIYIFLSFIKV